METNPLTYEEYLEVVEKTPLIGDEVCFLDTAASYLALKRRLTPDYFEEITEGYIEDCFNLDKRGIRISKHFPEVFEAKVIIGEEKREKEKVRRMDLFRKYNISYPID